MYYSFLIVIFSLLLSANAMAIMANELTVGLLKTDNIAEKKYLSLLQQVYPNHKITVQRSNNASALLEQLITYDIDLILPWQPYIYKNVLQSFNSVSATEKVIVSYSTNLELNQTTDMKKFKFGMVGDVDTQNIKGLDDNVVQVPSFQAGLSLVNKKQLDGIIHYVSDAKTTENNLSQLALLPAKNNVVAFSKTIIGRQLKEQFDASLNRQSDPVIQDQRPSFTIYLSGKTSDDNYDLTHYTSLILSSMGGYNISLEWMNNATEYFNSAGANNSCVMTMLKTPERLQKFDFSESINLTLGQRLYSLTPISSPEPISLTTLINQNVDLRLGFGATRSYGDKLDDEISNVLFKNKVAYDSSHQVLLKHFANKKFELLITYPYDFMHFDVQEKMYSYEVQNSPKFIEGYLMCGRSNLSNLFLKQFDHALTELTQYKQFFDSQLQYLPKSEYTLFAKYFKQIYK
ncbi:MAG: hypothetical protein ACJAZB_001195 [Psychrosphaera sp.]